MQKLYVKEVVGKGRGVFSNFDIKSGELIETAHTLIFPSVSGYNRTQTEQSITKEGSTKVKTIKIRNEVIRPYPEIIENVLFNWSDLVEDGENNFCVILGLGSIYNSANPSNLRFEGNILDKTASFYAVVDIPAHTELTINYSGFRGNHISENNNWFTNKVFIN